MKKFSTALLLFQAMSTAVKACPFCNKQVSEGIYNSTFYPNLFTMLSAFFVLAVIVVIFTALSVKRHRAKIAANAGIAILTPVPLTTAAVVLGIGMGGFFDGIVLHQILQVHEMLSNKISTNNYVGKSVNMFWDGIFHAFCFLVVLTGIVLLWKLLRRNDVHHSGKLLSGGLLLGWGLFNIVEGVTDHQILKLHNVVELAANHDIANYSFLGISIIMLLAGFALINSIKGAGLK